MCTTTSHFLLLLLLFRPTCSASDMCREATRVKRNVTGDGALRPSVCQPPVIRTAHMKAAADKTEERWARERGEKRIKERKPLRWKIEFYFPPTLPFCLPSIPQKSVLYPSRLSAHLCCILLQLKDWTRNDCLCPEISGPHSSVNSFGNQMLIHHISLTRI